MNVKTYIDDLKSNENLVFQSTIDIKDTDLSYSAMIYKHDTRWNLQIDMLKDSTGHVTFIHDALNNLFDIYEDFEYSTKTLTNRLNGQCIIQYKIEDFPL